MAVAGRGECVGTLIEEVLAGAGGEGHDRIGSLENAVSKWRQPTWRFVVKHQHCHKSQWPTSDVSDHVGNIRNSSDMCTKFTDRAVRRENPGTLVRNFFMFGYTRTLRNDRTDENIWT